MSVLTKPSAATDALVLRAWPCGETSVIASLLTRDLGFVKVLAKAARRPRSRLRPLVEPGRLLNLEFGLDPARELQYLRGGSVLLDPLAEGATLERSAYLLAALELVDRCRPAAPGPDQNGEDRLFGICEEFLAVLSSATCRRPAVLFFALEWRLLRAARHGAPGRSLLLLRGGHRPARRPAPPGSSRPKAAWSAAAAPPAVRPPGPGPWAARPWTCCGAWATAAWPGPCCRRSTRPRGGRPASCCTASWAITCRATGCPRHWTCCGPERTVEG